MLSLPKFKKFIFIGFFVFTLLVLTFMYLNKSNINKSVLSNISQIKNTIDTEMLTFNELTIPYLRNKSYISKLNKLEKFSENSSYTSYLTSYSSDNLNINGLLTVPKGKAPRGGFPAIVFVHGYIPPTIYKTTEKYVDYVDYLASSGFVVFKIDLRGHGQSEGQATGAYFSSDYIIDTLNAYSALQNSDFVNPNKIGLWGHSMAGNVIVRAAAVKPTIPAISIWAGAVYTYTDLLEYGIQDSSYRPPQTTPSPTRTRRQNIFEKIGTPSASNKFWSKITAVSFLNDLQGAVQINHALDDNVVNYKYSDNLNALLNKTKVPHELYLYKTGGHNISGESFNLAMERTVNFFNKYLKK